MVLGSPGSIGGAHSAKGRGIAWALGPVTAGPWGAVWASSPTERERQMNVLYGVVGEGMGHATRSRVVIEHLLGRGHAVCVVVSGRAYGFLRRVFADRRGTDPGQASVREIVGLHLVYEEGEVDKSESLWSNLETAPQGVRHNLRVYKEVVGDFAPDVVISDFESWAYFFGRNHGIPVISIDNMQIINRCRHELDVKSGPSGMPSVDYGIARLSVKLKLPGAWHYLVSSFFHPPVRKRRTTLVPPILRPEILAARREPGEHVLVYQTSDSNTGLLRVLSGIPIPFRVYGLGTERSPDLGSNVELRPFSQTDFVDDLRTARAVIAGGGYSLMGEAVHLRVPMLAVPLRKQFEQELNARYLAQQGYGAWTSELSSEVVEQFLSELDRYAQALQAYAPMDNSMLFGCLDELLRGIELGDPRPDHLQSPNLGDWVSAQIGESLGEEMV